MPYITREDGERFVIPSYRDILSAKKPSLLKKEILLLSQDYGEYITLQRKNITQYEVAFSPDPGYLLGETVWHYFKRPLDLIYCEAIPNTSEAIVVVVKGGSVYLDGSFPMDSIPDELVVFRTQQNNFDIYIYGDVPISATPQPGKLALDESSVRSFTVLDEPIFPTLPIVKSFQLQLVNNVLQSAGIGIFPIRQVLTLIILMGLGWMAYTYVTTHKKELPVAIVGVVNPYQLYIDAIASTPNPTDEISRLVINIRKLYLIPGWYPIGIQYSDKLLKANLISQGMKTKIVFDWAALNNAEVQITADGLYLLISANIYNRPTPMTITPIQEVLGTLIDRLANVVPGNNLSLSTLNNKGRYTEATLAINFSNISPVTLDLIGKQLANLPLVLTQVTMNVNDGNLSGTINLKVLGS